LKVRRNEIFVPESSGHKSGLAEAEVMPLHERSGAHFANTPQLCNLIRILSFGERCSPGVQAYFS
ncbi:MAG: hypothetical protein VB110_04010, partial [Bacteroidales bacterium]|nr:hypothetical protein [Bacteroidales bacterium]